MHSAPSRSNDVLLISIGNAGHVSFLAVHGDTLRDAGTFSHSPFAYRGEKVISIADARAARIADEGARADELIETILGAYKSGDDKTVQTTLDGFAQKLAAKSPLEIVTVLRMTYSARNRLQGWTAVRDAAVPVLSSKGADPAKELIGLFA